MRTTDPKAAAATVATPGGRSLGRPLISWTARPYGATTAAIRPRRTPITISTTTARIFGATDEKDFVAKVHHFIEHPPEGVQTVSRSNGDKLLYDAKSNTFAVERKDGAPRTMFKPHAGEAYWKEQQEKAASGDDSYGGRYKKSGGDEG